MRGISRRGRQGLQLALGLTLSAASIYVLTPIKRLSLPIEIVPIGVVGLIVGWREGLRLSPSVASSFATEDAGDVQ